MAEQEEVITLIDEDGTEHDFLVIDIIEVKAKDYAVLLPVNDENDEAIILKIIDDDEGNELLIDIEDDEEWEEVADAWESKASLEETK